MKQQKTFSLVAFAMLQAVLLLSACSSEENIPASGGIAVTDAHINISVAPFETSSGKAKTRAGGTDETKADTVLLANGMRAICTVEEDDEAEQTRAPKPIADGHYTIYACDPVTGNRITGPDKLLKGTVTGGVFQSDGGTRLFLDPGTYKFVCFNDAVEDHGTYLFIITGNYGGGTPATYSPSAGDAQIGTATETISGDNWQVNFTMRHQNTRIRMHIIAYSNHMDNAWGYVNGGNKEQPEAQFYNTDGTFRGASSTPPYGYTLSCFKMPATSTDYNATYVRAYDFYSDYMYLTPGIDIVAGDIVCSTNSRLYGKQIPGSGSPKKVNALQNHSYTVTYRILPDALYLFQDGSCGAYSEKGSRTAIAVVSKEKTNTEEGTAVALKDYVNQWGAKDFAYGSFPPTGTRLFKKNNTSNYSDMASTLNDVDGYKWTWETAGSADGTVKANDNNNYTCFYGAANYHPGVATQNIGKWYLPAAGEMKQLITCYGTPTITTIDDHNVELKFNYINLINKAFTDAGGDAISGTGLSQGYWTSSEVVYSGVGWASYQTPVLTYDATKKVHVVSEYAARHNNSSRIRPFVHF